MQEAIYNIIYIIKVSIQIITYGIFVGPKLTLTFLINLGRRAWLTTVENYWIRIGQTMC